MYMTFYLILLHVDPEVKLKQERVVAAIFCEMNYKLSSVRPFTLSNSPFCAVY